MHQYVGVIMDAAKMEKDKFVVPASSFGDFTKALRTSYIEDTSLFVHLVVAAARVKKAGLTALADQLVDLAKIGLDHKLMEHQQGEAAVRARQATKSLSDAPNNQAASSLKRGPMKGVGIRSGGSIPPKSK